MWNINHTHGGMRFWLLTFFPYFLLNKLKFVGIPLDRGAIFFKCQQVEAHQHPPLTKEKTQKRKEKRKEKKTYLQAHGSSCFAPSFPMLQIVPLRILKSVPFSCSWSFESPQPKCPCCPCFSSVGDGRECKGGVSKMREDDGLVGGRG